MTWYDFNSVLLQLSEKSIVHQLDMLVYANDLDYLLGLVIGKNVGVNIFFQVIVIRHTFIN